MKVIKGDLIQMALKGDFDVIAHGCNCFCTQGAGIAKQMAKTFKTNNPVFFPSEDISTRGSINKLGNIEYWCFDINKKNQKVFVVNAYTQYKYGVNSLGEAPLDYSALDLCFQKINHAFAGWSVGLPLIGCGLAGGDEETVIAMMKDRLKDVDLTVVEYKK